MRKGLLVRSPSSKHSLLLGDDHLSYLRATHTVDSSRNAGTGRVLVAARVFGHGCIRLAAATNDRVFLIKWRVRSKVHNKSRVFRSRFKVHLSACLNTEHLVLLGVGDARSHIGSLTILLYLYRAR